MFDIKEELKKLPDSPGVYLHKDEFGQIIYVGKAISLRNRVRQYFQSPKNQGAKQRRMVRDIAEFEYISCGSEMEALMLECNLIKKHRPKYNILLRDDKSYPYIKLTLGEDYPRLLKTRRIVNDGSKYFGPYADAGAVNTIIDLLNSTYSLKRCNATSFAEDFSPCLNYHINACRGICRGDISREEYAKLIDKVLDFLHGRDAEILAELQKGMKEASEALNFEQAASFRDRIEAINTIREKQRVVLSRPEDLDIILLSQGLSGMHAVLFTVRDGKLSGRDSFFLGDVQGEAPELIIGEFIKQYYHANVLIPKEILLSSLPSEHELLAEWLSQQRGSKVRLLVPRRGEKRALLELVREDTEEILKGLDERVKRQNERLEAIREGLAEIFGEEVADGIRRVEAYDISNMNGLDSVGGMVVFVDGSPCRNAYRRFKIKTVEGADDTGSLQEMLFRRFRETEKGNAGFSELPDLILMDGGLGQVNAAKAVLAALRLDIPVAGMVKDDRHRTAGLIYEGERRELKGKSQLFSYIGAIQEEVHRFAIDYHRKLRGKALTRSVLDAIPGIGEKRKMSLLSKFGSIDAIKAADVEELAGAPGMNMSVAENVYKYFASEENPCYNEPSVDMAHKV